MHKPGGNVSGTRNSSPLKEQLALALSLVPGLKNIGVVLNMSESNSVYMLEKLQEAARNFAIEVKYKAVANSADIKLATETLADNVDAFFLLQDSTVASSLPSLIKSATKYKKPVISSYVEAVEIGALGGLAFDEYNIGIQTGKMALRVLEGASIGNMDVEDPEKIDLVINQKQAKELGIKIPEDIIKKANLIY
ncbi:ABC transporter substrate binding protein [Candidatus Arcanobacter lacustris]|uniref:ABC transporter substrate binding protein n=1 Tax=Candidatus Arcanibacter lacustris TaxID=1607817 RepID=A0A0F5MQA4_9RICK|nr:ABC transporter substrate binding protein [Candidatus Arcanobacter lacustris]